jgi:hypothetical protein
MSELVIVACRDLQAARLRKLNQISSFFLTERERLFDIDMDPTFQAHFRETEMALGWRRDVNDVRTRLIQ